MPLKTNAKLVQVRGLPQSPLWAVVELYERNEATVVSDYSFFSPSADVNRSDDRDRMVNQHGEQSL